MKKAIVFAGLILALAAFAGLPSLYAQQQGAGQQGGWNCPMAAQAGATNQGGWFCPTGRRGGMGRGMMGRGCPMRATYNPPTADQTQAKPATQN